jgi:outer membrane protein OmpA-like peptidoglycan-associated protein
MTSRRVRTLGSRVLGVATVVLALSPGAALLPGPAVAATPTPSVQGDEATGVVEDLTLPVEDLSLPVEDLTFSEGSLDGALTDTGHRDFRLAADVLFAFDRADLSAKSAGLLRTVADTLTQQGAVRVAVTGFTDDAGSKDYNLDLSRRRAVAVQKALQAALGARVTVSATGLGETRPIADNATAAGRAANRRVEIRVT